MPAEDRGLRRLRRGFTFGTWLAVGWLSLVVAGALAAPFLPIDTTEVDLTERASPPSWGHPLGTTRRGTDMLALILDGARQSLLVGVGAAVLAVVVGGGFGLWAGYRKGWVDRIGVLVADTMVALPSLGVALVASLILGSSKISLTLLVGVLLSPGVFRIVRTATRFQSLRDYVSASRALGARSGRILYRELLPNVAVPLLAYGFIIVGIAILIEGALAFLGVASDPQSTSWGALIAAGQGAIERSPHLSLVPALVLMATLVALTVLGEGLQRDGLKPMRALVPPPTADSSSGTVAETPTAVSGNGVVRSGDRPVRPGDAVLSVRGLSVTYRTPFGDLPVLDGIDLDLFAGRTLAVVGESGSGKSTLIKAILGLLPDNGAITAGSVRLDGRQLVGRTEAELAQMRGRRVALVMQNPTTALNPTRTIGAQLMEPMRLQRGRTAAHARQMALELLDAVAVPDAVRRMGEYPHQLSGGLAQRVCIALALSCEPAVLLADEPTSALDTTVAAQVLDLIGDLRRERGLAVVLVSHSLDVVAARSDDVLVLHAGRVAELAPARQLFTSPRMPYTAALLAAVPRVTNPSHTRLAALPPGAGVLAALAPGCAFAARCPSVDDRCRRERPPLAVPADGPAAGQVACWHPVAPYHADHAAAL